MNDVIKRVQLESRHVERFSVQENGVLMSVRLPVPRDERVTA